MEFPCQKRLWRMLPAKDRALLRAVCHNGLSHRTAGMLLGVPTNAVSKRIARLFGLLRNDKVVRALQTARGHDLYLLQLHFIYRLPATRIAAYSGLGGDSGGQTPKAIRQRIRRILKNGDSDA